MGNGTVNDLSQSQFASASDSQSQRSEERIPLIRTAKLIFEDGEYPCVLRDISGNALRVKLYGAPLPPEGEPFTLEFGDGDRFEVTRIWERGGQAGLAFSEHQSLMSLLGDKGPFQKRAIRIAVDLPASVRSLGRHIDVHVCDLSHEGAHIRTEQMFSVDQQLRFDVPMLGEVYAKVRWRRHPDYGLAFVETFRFEEIASVAPDLQILSKSWREERPGHSGPEGDASGIAA